MTTNRPSPDPIDVSTPEAREHVERMLDEGVAESFPASDPVSLSQPHSRIGETSTAAPAPTALERMRPAWPLVLIAAAVVALMLPRRRR